MEPKPSMLPSADSARLREAFLADLSQRPDGAALAWRLNYLANCYTGPLYKYVEDCWGVSRPEFIVLFCLDVTPGLMARDVVQLSGRPKNSISRAVAAVVDKGLVMEAKDAGGRGQPLRLTAAGRSMVAAIRPLFQAREDQMLAHLTAGERSTLQALLRKLTARDDDWSTRIIDSAMPAKRTARRR
jgi:MarR family transcriptional regulator, temperature-dependent positive regulator of motility